VLETTLKKMENYYHIVLRHHWIVHVSRGLYGMFHSIIASEIPFLPVARRLSYYRTLFYGLMIGRNEEG